MNSPAGLAHNDQPSHLLGGLFADMGPAVPRPAEDELNVPPGHWLHQLALGDLALDLGHGVKIEVAAYHTAVA